MTEPPPPYGAPAGYPTPPPPKPRPSGWWFVVGGGLIVLAIAVGIGLFIWTLSSFLQTDARIAADGTAYAVTVGTDGDRMLWLEDGAVQNCSIIDAETDQPVEQGNLRGDFDRSDSDSDFYGAADFDPGSGNLTVTCSGGGHVLIGPAPQFSNFFAGVLLTIFIPVGLGLFGMAIVIVTGMLWATRPARSKT